MSTSRFLLSLLLASGASCLPPQENPTQVKDLRVLGMSFEPPDVLIRDCSPALFGALAGVGDGGLAGATDGGLPVGVDAGSVFAFFAAASRQVTLKVLIADPAGNGRQLDYRLLGCAGTGDRDCNAENGFVEIDAGQVAAGELVMAFRPGLLILPDGKPSVLSDAGTPLLLEAINRDTYKGLGGIRVPVVLDLRASDTGEHIYAQKLMVYMCQFFPQQQPNQLPRLPGLTWNGEPWPEGEVRDYQGTKPVLFEPTDFSALEEPYWLPSLSLQPVALQESWKINWLTSFGTMSAYGTGGTDFAGTTGRQRSTWQPDTTATTPHDVTFWFVVRDGRGGETWSTRQVRWSP
jgi:hypothetical protein